MPVDYPPPATEGELGSFRVECELSHLAQVDPIVMPGPSGTASEHLHEFFGNTSTDSDSTYADMVAADTTCGADGDTAGYWSPALLDAEGDPVPVRGTTFYYRNRPDDYGTTQPFPADLRVIAGGVQADALHDVTYWTCDGESDTGFADRKDYIPTCPGGEDIKLHIWFPSCWDGVHLDSADHRSHMAYGIDDDGEIDPTNPDLCPPSHPVKVPQLDFRVQFETSDGAGHVLADGNVLPHADFWNTWQQPELERWIAACLNQPQSCKEAAGTAP